MKNRHTYYTIIILVYIKIGVRVAFYNVRMMVQSFLFFAVHDIHAFKTKQVCLSELIVVGGYLP